MQQPEDKDKVVSFYDQFAEKQQKTGINSRHLSILDKVKMETYALFFEEKDYQFFVFRASKAVSSSTPLSKWTVLKERMLIRLKYGLTK